MEALWLFRCCPKKAGGKEYKLGIRHAGMGVRKRRNTRGLCSRRSSPTYSMTYNEQGQMLATLPPLKKQGESIAGRGRETMGHTRKSHKAKVPTKT